MVLVPILGTLAETLNWTPFYRSVAHKFIPRGNFDLESTYWHILGGDSNDTHCATVPS